VFAKGLSRSCGQTGISFPVSHHYHTPVTVNISPTQQTAIRNAGNSSQAVLQLAHRSVPDLATPTGRPTAGQTDGRTFASCQFRHTECRTDRQQQIQMDCHCCVVCITSTWRHVSVNVRVCVRVYVCLCVHIHVCKTVVGIYDVKK
jgi:hypothetical protein